MKFLRLAAAWALAALTIGAPAALAQGQGKVLKVSLSTELQILDPIVTRINSARVFAYLAYDTLVGMDSAGNFKPQMLESWTLSDDKLSYTFTLRDGLAWNDGTPVTPDDCIASLERWAKRDPFGGAMMDAVAEMRAVDAKRFTLQLRRPFGFVIEAIGRSGHQVPVMMPARLARLDASKPVPEVVGSGPFTFLRKEWRPGDMASFVPNPRYRPRSEAADGLAGGKVVKLDRVDIVSIADQTTRASALEAGELDWLEIAPLDHVAAMRADKGIVVGKPRGMDQYLAVLNVNHANPPFNDLKVRKALQAAIVQPEIAAAVGLPDDLVTPFCGSIYGCNTPRSTDAGSEALHGTGPDRARQLLKEAGYKGEPVVVFHSQTSALLNPIGMVVAAQLRRAGFTVQIESRDSATMQQRRLQRTAWSIVPVVLNGVDLMNPLANPVVAGNCFETAPGWYCDPRMTELLQRYAAATEPAEQRRLAEQIQVAAHDNVNYVIAGQFAAPPAWRANLTGVVPFAFPVFWNMARR